MDSFGLERSIEPRHALAQQAWKIDNTMTLRSDEVLIDVKIININLASFNEILDETGEDRALLCQRVLEIVRERGKLHNPVTNSGGMLYGTVVELGPSYPNIYHIRPKDEIISLSSLTVTPLHITQILRIDYESAQLEVEGQAILYANSPVVKKPPDLPLRAVIAAMDEAGAPTRSYQIVQPGQDVLILGASGRIGLMCGYAAKDKMGSSGRLVGIVRDQESRIQMEQCSVFDEVLELDATNLSALCGTPHAEIIQRFDVVINCINTADTEAASLLAVKNHGTIYFATICCDYKFVALTAESIGKEIQVIPYTGFLEGHADYTLGLMRRFPQMQTDIQRGICGVPETISIPNSDETPHAKSEADEDCASGYIFHSLEAKATLRQALKVARYTSNVMIYGESGVGKEIIARIIHQNSERKSFPMVKINCAAIPEHLLESELFGYEKGSFTGANIKGKIGLWEAAQNGTLFLDEVGELPLTFQAKLLRVIQEKEIVRVGGLTPIKVDVRIIAATNRNLARMVQAGEFREDLYYRLNVYPITVLPLRMRRADIIPLQVQCGERPCKAPDVEAPERDAGQGSGQPRPQGAGQLAVLGLLISSPMDRRGMLTSVARPAEQRLSRTQMFGVSRRILLGIAVLSGPAGAAIRKAHIFPVDELASIGLEPVYPHLCEIVSLGKPGLLCGRVGEVGDHGAGEPVSLRDGIGTPICVVDAEAPGNGIRPVQLILRIERLIRPLLFVDGDLPQQETDPLFM